MGRRQPSHKGKPLTYAEVRGYSGLANPFLVGGGAPRRPTQQATRRSSCRGAWDSLGEGAKRDYFEHISFSNPARRIGTAGDVANAVLFAMTNTFLTGTTLRIDGGEPLT